MGLGNLKVLYSPTRLSSIFSAAEIFPHNTCIRFICDNP